MFWTMYGVDEEWIDKYQVASASEYMLSTLIVCTSRIVNCPIIN